jgi:hypothetical protein
MIKFLLAAASTLALAAPTLATAASLEKAIFAAGCFW